MNSVANICDVIYNFLAEVALDGKTKIFPPLTIVKFYEDEMRLRRVLAEHALAWVAKDLNRTVLVPDDEDVPHDHVRRGWHQLRSWVIHP